MGSHHELLSPRQKMLRKKLVPTYRLCPKSLPPAHSNQRLALRVVKPQTAREARGANHVLRRKVEKSRGQKLKEIQGARS